MDEDSVLSEEDVIDEIEKTGVKVNAEDQIEEDSSVLDDAASPGQVDGKQLDLQEASVQEANPSEIKATVRVKSIRDTTSSFEKRKKEQDDKCKQTMHIILAILFVCQGMIIIFSFHNIYMLASSTSPPPDAAVEPSTD